ncbi:MAG: replication initiation factor domain-containing protein [Paucibacter sp.]|nr:replication initiation factor domain-containing protein [Roseateles sp.]
MMDTKSERLVLEGQRLKVLCAERHVAAAHHQGVVVDWLRFTFLEAKAVHLRTGKYQGLTAEHFARAVASEVAELLGFRVGETRKGRDFYQHTVLITNSDGAEMGYASAGNDRQRGTVCVNISGAGCTFAAAGWEQRVERYVRELDGKLTRIDLALDFFAGETDVVEALECYKTGAFDFQNRRPSNEQAGDWINGHARTFYVGRRQSGKLLRAYEKGHKYGDMADPWCRVEVEFRNHERVLPLAMLARPAAFFAGAYEYCELLLHRVDAARIKVGEATASRSAEALLRWVENTAAPAIVAITKAVGSTEWINDLVFVHRNRKAPRSIAAAGLRNCIDGIERAVARSLGVSWVAEPSVNPGDDLASLCY